MHSSHSLTPSPFRRFHVLLGRSIPPYNHSGGSVQTRVAPKPGRHQGPGDGRQGDLLAAGPHHQSEAGPDSDRHTAHCEGESGVVIVRWWRWLESERTVFGLLLTGKVRWIRFYR